MRGYVGMKRPKTEQERNLRIQLKMLNQKILVKGDLKDNKTGSSNTSKTGPSKITKENLWTSRWRMHEDIPTIRYKGMKQFWSKIWEQK